MSEKKPVSLMGRLAVQLKLITMEQLNEATSAQGRNSEKRLGDIFIELGFITPAQLGKLEKVQRDVVAKHRAKQALSSSVGEPEVGVAAAQPTPRPPPAAQPTPRPPAAPPVRQAAAPKPAVPLDAAPAAASPVQATAARAKAAEPAPVQAVVVEPEGESLGLSLSASPDAARLNDILREAAASGASDIHLHASAPIKRRRNGEMEAVNGTVLSPEDSEALALGALTPEQREILAREGEIDLCYAVEGVGRFRTNVYRQQRGFDAVFRSIPDEPPTLEELNLPTALAKYTNYHQGMVLITGPAGCGKSSTMAAMVNLINEERDEHILTVEDPIEYVHRPKRCLVNQRHAGRDTASFARALRGALREDPDVIVIGELRDLETISLAMTAAETGHFVLATLHTNNAIRTVNRMIGAFPSNQQDQVRTMLSESLRAVISQRLVNKKDGSGRIPALEILVINKAIGNLIRDSKTVQIKSSIQTGVSQGMCLLEQSLNELVKSGTISKEEALRYAEDEKLIK